MKWDDERVSLLRKLWRDGLSATDVARQLGGFEHCEDGGRSAVIGKVHRIGLPTRSLAQRKPISRPARISKERAAFVAGRPPFPTRPRLVASAPSNQLPLPFVPPAQRKSMATLGDHDCRWPTGDPRSADFFFCGRRKLAGLPYCEIHRRIAYQPPQPVRRAPVVVPVEAPKSRVVEVA